MVGDGDGLPLDHLVRREILQRERAAAQVHVVDDALGELAAVEDGRSVAREPLERVAELRNREALPCLEGAAGVAVHDVALGRVPEQRVEDPVQVSLQRRELEALARQRDGRGDELGPVQPAPAPVRALEAEGRAGHGDGGRAGPEHLLRVAVEVDRELEQVVGRCRGARHRDEEVEHRRQPARRLVHEHEAAAAGSRERALAHPRDERRRHTGVDGAAAGAEDAGTRLRGQGLARCDRTVHLSFTFYGNPAPKRDNLKSRSSSDDMKARK